MEDCNAMHFCWTISPLHYRQESDAYEHTVQNAQVGSMIDVYQKEIQNHGWAQKPRNSKPVLKTHQNLLEVPRTAYPKNQVALTKC